MTPILFPLAGNGEAALRLAAEAGFEPGRIEERSFPDGETYLRLLTPVAGRDVVLLSALDRPNEKFPGLAFAAAAARAQGATRVGLVAPYLAYMRQDKQFKEGEAVTSAAFARLLSQAVDWIVTVDPHLHRIASLEKIFPIPARVVRAAPAIADWIGANVRDALIAGPDAESAQWIEPIASAIGAPSLCLTKTRRGDRDVTVEVPAGIAKWRGRTPVIVDDIASSGHTLAEAIRRIRAAGLAAPVCVVVHAIFAGDALDVLRAAGPARVVSTNTIAHETNAIDVTKLIARAAKDMARR